MSKPKSYTAISRSNARRALLQTLYQWQITGDDPVRVKSERLPDPRAKIVDFDYFNQLYQAITLISTELNEHLSHYVQRAINQLDPVERAILWIGAYELLYRRDVHPSVVINEAIELAKHFGAEDSYKMVNKVLDQFKHHAHHIHSTATE
ncbi:MAG: transcription antitermination factor NusB [Cardiobacteriaceae bacterium]|nr:transcription antitermination factor NusB [Cardiobacteriaceae bacterium]